MRFSPNSDCICTNPTYTFSAASATRGVCRFLSKQARRARFEYIQHIRDLATKMHVTCPQTYLYTTVSCPYEGRAMYTSWRAKRASLLSCQLSSRYIIFIYLYIYIFIYLYIYIYTYVSTWIYGKTERQINKTTMPDECNFGSVTYALKIEAWDLF